MEVNVNAIKQAIKDIEKWKGEAYQDGDEVSLAIDEIKRVIGIDVISRAKLIDMLIEQIKEDIDNGDTTVLAELLSYIPNINLMNYLPEDVAKRVEISENV